MQRSLKLFIAAVALAAILSGSTAASAPAQAQTPIDGRIVRVVYQIGSLGTWGFHLAHMRDGRYCLRFGDPGRRLTIAAIQQAADICFDRVPATVNRSQERMLQAIDTSDGKTKTFVKFHKGSIAATGNAITLDVASCSRAEGVQERCFANRYLVGMNGQDCTAEITLPQGKASAPSCEHYAAH